MAKAEQTGRFFLAIPNLAKYKFYTNKLHISLGISTTWIFIILFKSFLFNTAINYKYLHLYVDVRSLKHKTTTKFCVILIVVPLLQHYWWIYIKNISLQMLIISWYTSSYRLEIGVLTNNSLLRLERWWIGVLIIALIILN